MEFDDFLSRYKHEALQIDLATEYPLVYEILERQKMTLNSVNFESEIDKVLEFCKKAVGEDKELLNTAILNKHYETKYPNGNPSFFLHIKMYFEHLKLYSEAIDKKKQFQKNPEAVKPDEVKKELHNDTFKYNAFEVFEIYKEKKEITAQSRTDLRVIFDLLNNDNLLLNTIELKHYIKWLNRVYFNGDIGELKVQNLKSKPNVIRTNDYILYRDTTLKKP